MSTITLVGTMYIDGVKCFMDGNTIVRLGRNIGRVDHERGIITIDVVEDYEAKLTGVELQQVIEKVQPVEEVKKQEPYYRRFEKRKKRY